MPQQKTKQDMKAYMGAVLQRRPSLGAKPFHFKADSTTGITRPVETADSKIGRLFYPTSTGRKYVQEEKAAPAPITKPKAPTFEIDRTPRLSMQETLRPEPPKYGDAHPKFDASDGPRQSVTATPEMDKTVIEHLKRQDLDALTDYNKNEMAWTFIPQQDGSYFIRPKEGTETGSTCRSDGRFCVHTHTNTRQPGINRNIYGPEDDETVKAGMPNYMFNSLKDLWVKEYELGEGYVDRYIGNIKDFE